MIQYEPDVHTLTSNFTFCFFFSVVDVRLASAFDICVYHLQFVFFFPLATLPLQSNRSLSCDHGLNYAS